MLSDGAYLKYNPSEALNDKIYDMYRVFDMKKL
jgi:hypothetical protein